MRRWISLALICALLNTSAHAAFRARMSNATRIRRATGNSITALQWSLAPLTGKLEFPEIAPQLLEAQTPLPVQEPVFGLAISEIVNATTIDQEETMTHLEAVLARPEMQEGQSHPQTQTLEQRGLAQSAKRINGYIAQLATPDEIKNMTHDQFRGFAGKLIDNAAHREIDAAVEIANSATITPEALPVVEWNREAGTFGGRPYRVLSEMGGSNFSVIEIEGPDGPRVVKITDQDKTRDQHTQAARLRGALIGAVFEAPAQIGLGIARNPEGRELYFTEMTRLQTEQQEASLKHAQEGNLSLQDNGQSHQRAFAAMFEALRHGVIPGDTDFFLEKDNVRPFDTELWSLERELPEDRWSQLRQHVGKRLAETVDRKFPEARQRIPGLERILSYLSRPPTPDKDAYLRVVGKEFRNMIKRWVAASPDGIDVINEFLAQLRAEKSLSRKMKRDLIREVFAAIAPRAHGAHASRNIRRQVSRDILNPAGIDIRENRIESWALKQYRRPHISRIVRGIVSLLAFRKVEDPHPASVYIATLLVQPIPLWGVVALHESLHFAIARKFGGTISDISFGDPYVMHSFPPDISRWKTVLFLILPGIANLVVGLIAGFVYFFFGNVIPSSLEVYLLFYSGLSILGIIGSQTDINSAIKVIRGETPPHFGAIIDQ